MQLRSGIVFCILAATALAQGSQSGERLRVERVVSGQTLTSMSDPRITLQFAPSFQYAGGQAFDLLGTEVAEEHLFVVADLGRSIQRFFWVQFEHYLPSNNYKIDYSSIRQQPLRLGPITFLADTKIGRDYFTSDTRPGSDSVATLNLLREKGYKVDGDFARVRLFYLPDASKRKELMIIYGERLTPGASPDKAIADCLKHVREYLTVQ